MNSFQIKQFSARDVMFILSLAWDKEKNLSPRQELNLSPLTHQLNEVIVSIPVRNSEFFFVPGLYLSEEFSVTDLESSCSQQNCKHALKIFQTE